MTSISTTGNIGKGSASVDVADQTGIVEGMRVSGLGIPFGAKVFRVGTPNLIMLTDNAMDSADGVALTFADDVVEEKPAAKAPNPPPAAVQQAVVAPPPPIGKATPTPPTAKERAAKPKSKPAAKRR